MAAAGQGVHGIMATHGGAITATSEPGQGTTFEVYLPIIRANSAEHVRKINEPADGVLNDLQ